jgi:protein gp37
MAVHDGGGGAAVNRTRIEWTDFTWNPVTGCLHDCDYCYARRLTVRFPANFPSGFAPAFHQERLGHPCRVKRPSRVFVCSMADLFGAWVPGEWIAAVFETVRSCPRHTFQFLTKNPDRYRALDLPVNAWYGTTVDAASAVGRIDALRDLDRTTFVSFEPLVEELEPDLTGIDAVLVGARTQPLRLPRREWVAGIVVRARKAGAAVFMKDSLAPLCPRLIRELPLPARDPAPPGSFEP